MEMSRSTECKSGFHRLGDGLARAGRDTWLVGLGALATTGDAARETIGKLRTRGESFRASEDNLVGRAVERAGGKAKKLGGRVEGALRRGVDSALRRAGVPSREEIHTLVERVEQLTAKVDNLGARR